nr:hypothetical protein CFP56_11354 [Quercus suber]
MYGPDLEAHVDVTVASVRLPGCCCPLPLEMRAIGVDEPGPRSTMAETRNTNNTTTRRQTGPCRWDVVEGAADQTRPLSSRNRQERQDQITSPKPPRGSEGQYSSICGRCDTSHEDEDGNNVPRGGGSRPYFCRLCHSLLTGGMVVGRHVRGWERERVVRIGREGWRVQTATLSRYCMYVQYQTTLARGMSSDARTFPASDDSGSQPAGVFDRGSAGAVCAGVRGLNSVSRCLS